MKCPECGSESRTNELYCRVCGTEIRLTYDQVHSVVSDEIQSEKEKSTEFTLRMVLIWMVFFLFASITMYQTSLTDLIGDETSPELSYHVPLYSSVNELVRYEIYENTETDTIAEIEARAKANREKADGTGPKGK